MTDTSTTSTPQNVEPRQLVYLPGIGHVSQAYASLRSHLRDLTKSFNFDNVSGQILNEDTSRVRIVVEGLNQSQIVKQKHEIAAKVREIYPGIRLLNSRVRNHSIWCCYFSDGNFNTYACGFEFNLPTEAERS